MDYVDGILLVAMTIGALAGGYAFARSPDSYVALFKRLAIELLPYIQKRNTPEVEEQQRQAARRGQDWDNFTKQPKERNK